MLRSSLFLPLSLCVLAALFAEPAMAQEPAALDSSIAEVTVYPSSARVVRVAEGLAGDGSYVLRGLPYALDPDSVRVRCVGGYVVGVEVRERVEDRSPVERLEELRLQRRELTRSIETERDELAVLEQRGAHLRALLARTAAAERQAVRDGSADVSTWSSRHQFIADGLRENARRKRELGWTLQDLHDQLAALERETADREQGTAITLRDVVVKLAGSAEAKALEVAYLVEGASWQPRYDVRAAVNGKRVTLGYRGEIYQHTGEDWSDVRLLLSSAEPKRSARGPQLQQRWAWLYDPRKDVVASEAMPTEEASAEPYAADLMSLGYTSGDDSDGFAEVLTEGLSVRFVVPGTDSVESGAGSTTVQVGEVPLDIRPEYYCVPRLDTTVWLRGYATNEGRWPILPGPAAVYFGEDFLGHAGLEQAEVGQEFTVPLGAADAITCERIKTKDFAEGPSFFGSNAKQTESWRLTFTNNGGAIQGADGSVEVVVREALPQPTDKKIKVALEGVSQPVSRAETWKKDAEELGFQTWVLELPLSEKVELRYSIAVTHPQEYPVSYR